MAHEDANMWRYNRVDIELSQMFDQRPWPRQHHQRRIARAIQRREQVQQSTTRAIEIRRKLDIQNAARQCTDHKRCSTLRGFILRTAENRTLLASTASTPSA